MVTLGRSHLAPVRNFQPTHDPWGLQFEAILNYIMAGGTFTWAMRSDSTHDPIQDRFGKQGLQLERGPSQTNGGTLCHHLLSIAVAKDQHQSKAAAGRISTASLPLSSYGKVRYNCEGDRPATHVRCQPPAYVHADRID